MLIRDARPEDLPGLFRLTLAGLDAEDLATSVTDSDIHPFHEFAMTHGRVLVAETGGSVVGYSSVIEHDHCRILSQLFVDRARQSRGVGAALLDEIDPQDGHDRMLLATSDPRAVALYARRGFVPGWPTFTLRIPHNVSRAPASGGIEVAPVQPSPVLTTIDGEISGRIRPAVHGYWRNAAGGHAYLLRRAGQVIGYGWIHDPLRGALRAWHAPDDPVVIGPVGVHDLSDSAICVQAMVCRARHEFPNRGAAIEIGGPHPALPRLLSGGARIVDAELAMSSTAAAFGDPERYVPSGGILY